MRAEAVHLHQDPLALSPRQRSLVENDLMRIKQSRPLFFNGLSERFSASIPSYKRLHHRRLAFFAYPLTGGFEHPSLMPTWMMRPVLTLERFLGVSSRYLAFRLLIVSERESP